MGGDRVALLPKLKQLAMVLAVAAGLAACVAAPGGKSGKAEGPNPVTGDAIEVTALDGGPAAKPEKPGKPVSAESSPEAAPEAATVEDSPAASPGQTPKARPEPAPDAAVEAPPPMPEAAPPVPQAEKTAAQIACEKRGNIWSKAGKSDAFTCIKRLGDGGKRCTNGDQCQGECLARSNTCAPMTPLFGCNEVLQDNGSRVTLCLD